MRMAPARVCARRERVPHALSCVCAGQEDLLAALDSLKQRYPHYLPSNERVMAFSQWDKLPSLAEYLDIFEAPVEFVLESNLVWPAPAPLEY
jgi:hypothetical protein